MSENAQIRKLPSVFWGHEFSSKCMIQSLEIDWCESWWERSKKTREIKKQIRDQRNRGECERFRVRKRIKVKDDDVDPIAKRGGKVGVFAHAAFQPPHIGGYFIPKITKLRVIFI